MPKTRTPIAGERRDVGATFVMDAPREARRGADRAETRS